MRVHPDSTTRFLWWKSFIMDVNADKAKVKPGRDVHPYFHDDQDYFSYENAAFAIAPAADSGVIVAGVGANSLTAYDGWVMKLKPNGTQLWQTQVGSTKRDVGRPKMARSTPAVCSIVTMTPTRASIS